MSILGTEPEVFTEAWDAFLARVYPDDRDALQAALTQTRTDGQALNHSFRIVRDSGAVAWVEAHARIYDGTEPDRVIGVLKDITERRQTEEQLRQAAAVFESTAEGIFNMDAEHRIVSVNPAFTSITGYRPEEVLGLDPDIILHARRHSDEFYPQLQETKGGQWQGEIYCRRKNGDIFPA